MIMSALLRAGKKLTLARQSLHIDFDNKSWASTVAANNRQSRFNRKFIQPATCTASTHTLISSRCLSSAPQNKGGFFGQVFENIKQEIEKNKEMKESLKKFREEAQKLEESDALKKARKKFVGEILVCLHLKSTNCFDLFLGKY